MLRDEVFQDLVAPEGICFESRLTPRPSLFMPSSVLARISKAWTAIEGYSPSSGYHSMMYGSLITGGIYRFVSGGTGMPITSAMVPMEKS